MNSKMSFENIEQYANSWRSHISAESNADESFDYQSYTFCSEWAFPILHDSGDADNILECHYTAKGVKISGWQLNDQQNELILLVESYKNELISVPLSEIKKVTTRTKNFFTKSVQGLVIPPSHEAYDVQKTIQEYWKTISRVRIIFLTDGDTKSAPGWKEEDGQVEFSYEIWDIHRFYRFETSGEALEPIEIEFKDITNEDIILIKSDNKSKYYESYLGFLKGNVLSAMYDKFSTRLLERNVRLYLQARSKVNKGMINTLENQPFMFLAYNNGLTVIAKSIELKDLGNNAFKLVSAEDFQIVNGGQTCASIWETSERRKVDINQVQLVMKLNIVKEKKYVEEIAPKISKYSNSQNPVNIADFSSNDPFLVELQNVSRNIYAPDPSGGGQQTRWFYERARGSYMTEKNLEGTAARKRKWAQINPTSQKFDKLLMAKVEMAFGQCPDNVSIGGQKNFGFYLAYLKERYQTDQKFVPDEGFFKQLVAKVIIWKQLEKIVGKQNRELDLQAYRGQIVAYVYSYYVLKVASKVDLVDIWNNQDISEEMREVFRELSMIVRDHIKDTTLNVTEYCKKIECWSKLKSRKPSLSILTKNHFSSIKGGELEEFSEIKEAREKKKKEMHDQLAPYLKNGDKWFELAKWGKETKFLQPWQNSMSFNVGKNISNGKESSEKLLYQAKKIIKLAESKGFNFSDE
jgi:hypothetical protein